MNETCLFIALSLLPASAAVATHNATFLVFSLFTFSLCWTEEISLKNGLSAVLCASGVCLVIQPWMPQLEFKGNDILDLFNATFSHVTTTTDHVTDLTGNLTEVMNMTHFAGEVANNESSVGFIAQIIGYVFAASAGVALPIDVLLVKRNPYFNDNILEVVFWNFVTNTCFSVVIMFIIETPVLPNDWFDTAMVTIHGLTFASLWPLYICAPKYVSGNTVTAILSTQVVFMLISQYTMLSSILPGHRNWMELVGVVLVMLGSSSSSLLEIFKTKQL